MMVDERAENYMVSINSPLRERLRLPVPVVPPDSPRFH